MVGKVKLRKTQTLGLYLTHTVAMPGTWQAINKPVIFPFPLALHHALQDGLPSSSSLGAAVECKGLYKRTTSTKPVAKGKGCHMPAAGEITTTK